MWSETLYLDVKRFLKGTVDFHQFPLVSLNFLYMICCFNGDDQYRCHPCWIGGKYLAKVPQYSLSVVYGRTKERFGVNSVSKFEPTELDEQKTLGTERLIDAIFWFPITTPLHLSYLSYGHMVK